jgi:8-oxo-dGTP pyrophosphatase MutT (NUDIX family)
VLSPVSVPSSVPVPAPDQSAVVPYRIRDGQPEILLVTTRGKGRWIVPKGNIEPKLGAKRSAEREAEEEAGVTGTMSTAPFGRYRHGIGRASRAVDVYLLRVEKESARWLEDKERRRRWFPAEEAARFIGIRGLRLLLSHIAAYLRSDAHPPLPWDTRGR